MKKLIYVFLLVIIPASLKSQENQFLKLPEPDKEGGIP